MGADNTRPIVDRKERHKSPISELKSFNNWVKAVLILKYGSMAKLPQEDKVRVLDLGCGKGGDLAKWAKVGAGEYVGIGKLAAFKPG